MSETIKERLERREREILSPRACLSSRSRGREREEEPCSIRTVFQRDRDRIIHSKAFRRLKHKTQVFLAPAGDHYRTRLTHTLEVSQIARTISRSLGLNEDLTEAIGLAHDLGHTPFGHAGEKVLNDLISGGFNHYEQSLRVVDILEKNGRGLNLTEEVRDGILKHSKGKKPIVMGARKGGCITLEADVVRISDIIAYVNHDIDDALRAGFIKPGDIPLNCLKVLGEEHSERIDRMVRDVVDSSLDTGLSAVIMSDGTLDAVLELRDYLFKTVYESPLLEDEFRKAEKVLRSLYEHVIKNPGEFFPSYMSGESEERLAADFIAGMTDRYAIKLFSDLHLPRIFSRQKGGCLRCTEIQ